MRQMLARSILFLTIQYKNIREEKRFLLNETKNASAKCKCHLINAFYEKHNKKYFSFVLLICLFANEYFACHSLFYS